MEVLAIPFKFPLAGHTQFRAIDGERLKWFDLTNICRHSAAEFFLLAIHSHPILG